MRTAVIGIVLFILSLAVSGQTRKSPRRATSSDSAAGQQSREAQDRAGIQKLQDRDIAASMSFDPDALTSLWTDDGVLMIPGQAPIHGLDAIRMFYEKQRDSMANVDVMAYEEEWQEVRVVGDYAYEWGQIHGRTRKGQGTVENSVTVNAMRILKREEGGAWKIHRAIWNEARAGTSVGAQPTPSGERR
jgi:uncharacterized protein (TIGR02246 family)